MGIQIATAAGNGATTPVALNGNDFLDSQTTPLRTLFVGGTFDGATVAAEVSPDGGTTWFAVPGADAIAAATVLNIEVRADQLRLNVAGGGGSVAIDAWRC